MAEEKENTKATPLDILSRIIANKAREVEEEKTRYLGTNGGNYLC